VTVKAESMSCSPCVKRAPGLRLAGAHAAQSRGSSPILRSPAVPVAISGNDQKAIALLVEAIESGMKETLTFLKLASPVDTPLIDVRCETSNDFYRITQVNTEYPGQEVTTTKGTVAQARSAFEILYHMARWFNLLNLQNPTTRLPADAVAMDLHPLDPQTGERMPANTTPTDLNLIQVAYNPAKNPAGVPSSLA